MIIMLSSNQRRFGNAVKCRIISTLVSVEVYDDYETRGIDRLKIFSRSKMMKKEGKI